MVIGNSFRPCFGILLPRPRFHLELKTERANTACCPENADGLSGCVSRPPQVEGWSPTGRRPYILPGAEE